MAARANPKRKATVKGAKPKAAKGKKAGPGHNSGAIPDEVYERHLKKIDQTAKAMDKAKLEFDQKKGEHQSAFKSAKSDGLNTDAIKLARKLDSLDAGQVLLDYSETGKILKLMRSPLSVQMSLFDITLPKDVQAAMDGKAAGKMSAPRDTNPHAAGSPEFVEWDQCWLAAQNELSPELRVS